jgi:hypothetical protein
MVGINFQGAWLKSIILKHSVDPQSLERTNCPMDLERFMANRSQSEHVFVCYPPFLNRLFLPTSLSSKPATTNTASGLTVVR